MPLLVKREGDFTATILEKPPWLKRLISGEIFTWFDL